MVEDLKNVHTADGMGRAWIRMLLTKNTELLHQCLQSLIDNQTFTRYVVLMERSAMSWYAHLSLSCGRDRAWYAAHSLLVTHEDTSRFLSLVAGLCMATFRITYDDSSVDFAPPKYVEPFSRSLSLSLSLSLSRYTRIRC